MYSYFLTWSYKHPSQPTSHPHHHNNNMRVTSSWKFQTEILYMSDTLNIALLVSLTLQQGLSSKARIDTTLSFLPV